MLLFLRFCQHKATWGKVLALSFLLGTETADLCIQCYSFSRIASKISICLINSGATAALWESHRGVTAKEQRRWADRCLSSPPDSKQGEATKCMTVCFCLGTESVSWGPRRTGYTSGWVVGHFAYPRQGLRKIALWVADTNTQSLGKWRTDKDVPSQGPRSISRNWP